MKPCPVWHQPSSIPLFSRPYYLLSVDLPIWGTCLRGVLLCLSSGTGLFHLVNIFKVYECCSVCQDFLPSEAETPALCGRVLPSVQPRFFNGRAIASAFSHSAFNGRAIASAWGGYEQCCCKCGVHTSVLVPALEAWTPPGIAGSYVDPVFNCVEEPQAALSSYTLIIDTKAPSLLTPFRRLCSVCCCLFFW